MTKIKWHPRLIGGFSHFLPFCCWTDSVFKVKWIASKYLTDMPGIVRPSEYLTDYPGQKGSAIMSSYAKELIEGLGSYGEASHISHGSQVS